MSLDEKSKTEEKRNFSKLLIETVTCVRPSFDKKKILLGTNHGRIVLLNIDDFKVEKTLKDEGFITSLKDNKNILVSGHGNGMVIRYKKDDYSSLCFRK